MLQKNENSDFLLQTGRILFPVLQMLRILFPVLQMFRILLPVLQMSPGAASAHDEELHPAVSPRLSRLQLHGLVPVPCHVLLKSVSRIFVPVVTTGQEMIQKSVST